jgi:predicted nucleic acid binding AN1-type Zn finger protein
MPVACLGMPTTGRDRCGRSQLACDHYTGILSVESLFDVMESRLPTSAELKAASLKTDCASTRLFMRQVDAFIKHGLGIDPTTKRRLTFQGLLGDVKAYFGMVETQGRGTLHIHMLIWLKKCPPNSTAIEQLLNSPSGTLFQDRVASNTQSVVSNNLPIGVEKCGCSQCGAPFSELVGLRIPDSARKDPISKTRASRTRRKVREPALIQCTSCQFRFSSQHLLRSALLRCYPNQWPPRKRLLSRQEVKNQAAVELSSRGTMKEAVDIIDDR